MSKLPAPYRALQEEMAARHRRDECTIAQLRARNAELERQLAEANVRFAEVNANAIIATNRAEQAEQRIAESRAQDPVCWIEADPSAKNESAHNVFGSMIYSTAICVTKPERGNPTWALYAIPIVPPTVEEAVKAEREACADIASNHECGGEDDIICQGQNCGTCIAGSIRARNEK